MVSNLLLLYKFKIFIQTSRHDKNNGLIWPEVWPEVVRKFKIWTSYIMVLANIHVQHGPMPLVWVFIKPVPSYKDIGAKWRHNAYEEKCIRDCLWWKTLINPLKLSSHNFLPKYLKYCWSDQVVMFRVESDTVSFMVIPWENLIYWRN